MLDLGWIHMGLSLGPYFFYWSRSVHQVGFYPNLKAFETSKKNFPHCPPDQNTLKPETALAP